MVKKKTKKARPTKKTAKKKVSRKPAKRTTSKKGKKKTKLTAKTVKQKGQLIGKVTHYFPHVNAAVLVVKKGPLKIGDTILIKGHTTHFEQQIESMQIDRTPITVAKKGEEIGLGVKGRVREHDKVYKI